MEYRGDTLGKRSSAPIELMHELYVLCLRIIVESNIRYFELHIDQNSKVYVDILIIAYTPVVPGENYWQMVGLSGE